MLTCLRHNVYILHLNALQGNPPMFMQLHKEQNVCYQKNKIKNKMLTSHVISLDIFWNSKSLAEASAYISVRFSVKLKLPTIIGDMRVKIISQILNLKLITNWRA